MSIYLLSTLCFAEIWASNKAPNSFTRDKNFLQDVPLNWISQIIAFVKWTFSPSYQGPSYNFADNLDRMPLQLMYYKVKTFIHCSLANNDLFYRVNLENLVHRRWFVEISCLTSLYCSRRKTNCAALTLSMSILLSICDETHWDRTKWPFLGYHLQWRNLHVLLPKHWPICQPHYP